jgi:N6-L-threonylcarbamoyladenine synthase
MKILGIETSCDETAVSLIEAAGQLPNPTFKVLGDSLYSQIKIHAEYGGVFPMIAKRHHALNIVQLLAKTLQEAGEYHEATISLNPELEAKISKLLEREDDLGRDILTLAKKIQAPKIDAIAVTFGPGLEPALWVGVNFARTLSLLWNIPIIPTNHMQGHIYSVLLSATGEMQAINFPIVSLLISGGHTELVKLTDWTQAQVIGRTRDDAVGEAFDKVARILGLPYPGGPEISKLAIQHRAEGVNEDKWKLPRPMINSGDTNFSFSGLKTAVLYAVKKHGDLSDQDKKDLAREFEDAVVEVLVKKTKKAVEEVGSNNVIIGGGVSCNKAIRSAFEKLANEENLNVILPNPKMSTDNSVMIAIAGYINLQAGAKTVDGDEVIKAVGNLSF